MIYLYRIAYLLFAPFIILFGLLFSKKIRAFFFKRASNLKKQHNKTIWLHTSSGEFEHAKPLLRKIKAEDPYTKIVVTYSSPSYFKAISMCKEVDYFTPYPIDLKSSVASLIKKINPKVFLAVRTDLWPELLHQLKRKNIPSLLFSRHENAKNKGIKKLLYSLTYQKLSHISFVTEEDVNNFKKIKPLKSFSIDGDPRHEEVFFKKEILSLNDIKAFKNTLILGSVWKEDMQFLTAPIVELLTDKTLEKLIIAPHEPSSEMINKLLKDFNHFKPNLYSKDQNLESKVVIVDQIGHLFKLYANASFAFVGGSFKKKVHSVIEPLSFNIPVLVGPKHLNSSDALTFLKSGEISCIETGNDFKEKLKELLNKNSLIDTNSGLNATDLKQNVTDSSDIPHSQKFQPNPLFQKALQDQTLLPSQKIFNLLQNLLLKVST